MKKIIQLALIIALLTLNACSQKNETPKITFIELGSVRCIPCQKMQSVIKKVEKNYPKKVKTVFYDVWTEKGKKAAKNFEFDEIPTQIFLDENGVEYARHVGYFPYKDLEKILLKKLN